MVFQDQILVRPGGPVFDLLNGYPAGNGGGEPQHQVEAQAGVTWRGLGVRASGRWQSATFISGEGSPTGALYFAPLATMDLRLFADFAQRRSLIVKYPILMGTRVTLSVTNLFDNRQKVRDANGITPVSYQPAYLDPVGRVVRLSVRKLFF
jgi:outer membrane receptor protein involved in Fe transport